MLRLRYNVTLLITRTQSLLLVAASMVATAVVVLTLALMFIFCRTIVSPIKQITDVRVRVTDGSFDRKVALESRSEIGQLGTTINRMVDGLKERYELSKFVSSWTLRAVQNRSLATALEISLLFTDIREFGRYSLEQEPERVIEYLNRVLTAQTELIHQCGGDVDKYVGDALIAFLPATTRNNAPAALRC